MSSNNVGPAGSSSASTDGSVLAQRKRMSIDQRTRMQDLEIPSFSAQLEAALSEVVPSKDPLDDSDFDAVDYINRIFPDERSLFSKAQRDGGDEDALTSSLMAGDVEAEADADAGTAEQGAADASKSDNRREPVVLNSFLNTLQRRVRYIEDDIAKNVKQHSCQRGKTRDAIADAKGAIKELRGKIHSIKEKAERSETMVQEICRDIKSLDYAKRHLTSTITSLQQLRMLVSAVDQLTFNANKKQYRSSAQLFRAVDDFFLHFKDYTDIPQIHNLWASVQRTKEQLKLMILRDFAEFGPEPAVGMTDTQQMLADACSVVDVLGDDVKEELLGWFISKRLEGYTAVFAPGREGGTLDQTERRYAWLKRQLRSYAEIFESVYPKSWEVQRRIAKQFCIMTRQHLSTILMQAQGNYDTAILIKMLLRTKDFEHELKLRFPPPVKAPDLSKYADAQPTEADEQGPSEPQEMGAVSSRATKSKGRRTSGSASASASANEEKKRQGPVPPDDKFAGMISAVFMNHLGGYVDLERKQIKELLDRVAVEEQWVPPEELGKDRLRSSDELLQYIKKSLSKSSRLTTGRILFDICKEYQRGIVLYAELMDSKLPLARDTERELSTEQLRTTCIVINTAEYCSDTLNGLQDGIQKVIDDKYKELVDLSGEKDTLATLCSRAISVYVAGVTARVRPALVSMSRMPWSTWENVGDQSDYATRIHHALAELIPTARNMLSKKYFNSLCSQMVGTFVPLFEEHLYKAKRVNEMGAQQLSLDTHALKSVLLDMPHMGKTEEEKDGKPPARLYVRLVTRQMSRIEALLKVLQSPLPSFIVTFKTLLPDAAKSDTAAAQLAKLLDLRGVRRDEQRDLLDVYNNSVPVAEQIQAATDANLSLRRLFNLGKP